MANASEDYYDLTLQHQIDTRAYEAAVVAQMLRLLEQSDKELVAKLRDVLPALVGKDFNEKGQQWRSLLKDVRETRDTILKQVADSVQEGMPGFAEVQAEAELGAIRTAIGIDIDFARVPVEQLRAAAISVPFAQSPEASNSLMGWFRRLAEVDKGRIEDAIRLGIVQGETVNQIIRRLVGTKAQRFGDGRLSLTRRNAEAVARTGVAAVNNMAREMVWDANADISSGILWVSTLDGRTSAICRARDGHAAPLGTHPQPEGFPPLVPKSARPPAHVNCRSTTVLLFDGEGITALIGERPFVRSTKRREQREPGFKAQAKAEAGERWRSMSAGERTAAVRGVRDRWAAENIGRVSQRENYNDWLFRQPREFQDRVLGPTRADIFRKGNLKLDQFVDRKGRELTLTELRELANGRRE